MHKDEEALCQAHQEQLSGSMSICLQKQSITHTHFLMAVSRVPALVLKLESQHHKFAWRVVAQAQ